MPEDFDIKDMDLESESEAADENQSPFQDYIDAAHESSTKAGGAHDDTGLHEVAFQEDAPESGTYEYLQHLIRNGNMISDGRFTQEGLTAIMDYIENGPANYGSIVGNGAGVRAGYVTSLLNQHYSDSQWQLPTLNGPGRWVPGPYAPFSVDYTAGYHTANGNQIGSTFHPPSLAISQQVNGQNRVIARR